MSKEYLVLSALGSDKVGIVQKLTSWLENAGANIEDSKMAVLGGEFAVIMLVGGDQGLAGLLASKKNQWEEELCLTIELKETVAPEKSQGGRPYMLESVSLDTPGIVHAVTSLIGSHDLNIEDLETDRSHAPWTGAPIFRMKIHLVIPPGFNLSEFREALSVIEHEKDLDIKLSPVTSSAVEW